MFVIIYMPELEIIKDGFDSEDLAWEYIEKNCLCSGCKQNLKEGFVSCAGFNDEGEFEQDEFKIDHVSQTSCAAEYEIIEENKIKEKMSFREVLEAAGYKKNKKNLESDENV